MGQQPNTAGCTRDLPSPYLAHSSKLLSTFHYPLRCPTSAPLSMQAVVNEAAVRLVALHRENEGLVDEKEGLEVSVSVQLFRTVALC